ncbi:Spermidine N(1)-acetyltransferase [Hypsizygus marmoreus]|uniref:Spermidine N(1)-acetyltransferase n=1 Tax=Hypsizygus marmoreus TaxID=39966 RepID=A0A369J9M6_HYPMA|nr:Spermidine N(1)-acetyltransferase [Hypsizygus marmoreus]
MPTPVLFDTSLCLNSQIVYRCALSRHIIITTTDPHDMFTTKRLRFRAYNGTSDLDKLLELFNDVRVVTYVTEGYVVPRSVNNFDKVQTLTKDCVMFCMVEELDGGSFVGFTAILPMSEPKNRNASWGIALAPEHWSKGYGWEIGNFMVDYAFRCLASHRVGLVVFEGNDRAVELYKRIGFIEEGRIRKAVWIDGGWRDTIHMGILDDEWAVIKQERAQEATVY